MNRLAASICLAISFSALTSEAAVTLVTLESGLTIYNNSGSALSGGTTADGNGTVLQLGYFTGASAANNFAGTWVPLTGMGSANTSFNTTSIGDSNANAAGDGTFAFDVLFDTSISGASQNLPGSTSIPLAIRFYDATTLGASTYYNTVSSDTWLWQTPGNPSPIPPKVTIQLDSSVLEWQDSSNPFKTSIAVAGVPEPSRLLLGMLGLIAVGLRRRR